MTLIYSRTYMVAHIWSHIYGRTYMVTHICAHVTTAGDFDLEVDGMAIRPCGGRSSRSHVLFRSDCVWVSQ